MDLSSYIFAPGSEIVFVTNNSGMKILDDSYLQLRGTHVHGCNRLWDKILVVGGGRLDVVQGSKIEDAVRAVEIEPDGVFSSSLSEFDGNYISIFAGHYGLPKTLAGFSIYGTVFKGSKTLIQSHTDGSITYSKPRIGIDVNNLASLQIAGGTDSGTNTFRDYQSGVSGQPVYAIKVSNSNVNISNSKFINIGTYSSSSVGYGIFGESFGTNQIIVTGLGGVYNSQATFTNVYNPVHVVSVRLIIKYCRVDGSYTGVIARHANSTPYGTLRTIVEECRFERTWLSGIALYNVFPSKSVSISDNTILFDVQDAQNEGPKTGIFMRNNVLTGSPDVPASVSRNIITYAPTTATGIFTGIEIVNLSRITVEENEIKDENATGGTIGFQGIVCKNAPKTIVSNNIIEGLSTSYPGVSIGIYNKESNNTTFLCNSLNESEIGVYFDGMNCDATDFQTNYMQTHNTGLYLENNTIIGDQVEKFNRWAGSTGQIEGYFNFIDFDETDAEDINHIEMSKFHINTFNESSNRWANPRVIPKEDNTFYYDDDNYWFVGSSEETFNALCSSSSHTRTEMNNRVIAGTFDAVRNITATEWEAKYHTYSRLTDFSDLRPSPSAAATWYSTNSISTFAILSDIENAMMSLWSYSPTSIAAEETLVDLIAGRDAKELEWTEETNPITKETLIHELDSLNQLVIAAQDDFEIESTSDGSDISSIKYSLLTTLGGLSLSTTHEENMRDVFEILLNTDGGATGLSLTQIGQLEDIANQCRLEGGYAVVLARIALESNFDYSSTDETCGVEERKKSGEDTMAINAVLITNPLHDNLAVRWNVPISKAAIYLCDITGKKVAEWNISEKQLFSTGINALPGIYLLQIQTDGQTIETHKLIIH